MLGEYEGEVLLEGDELVRGKHGDSWRGIWVLREREGEVVLEGLVSAGGVLGRVILERTLGEHVGGVMLKG